MAEKQVLAVDMGASSGRVMSGNYDGKRIHIHEIHRFSNEPVRLGTTMYWDFLRLFHEIKQGMIGFKSIGKADSIGIDTWGVDFGLVDKTGFLLENPVHYRDERTKGMLEEGFKLLDKEKFYQITGNQFMEINTAFQILSLTINRPEILDRANKILLMPDLFNYFLCGESFSEYSIASTTQLMDAKKKQWSDPVMETLGFRKELFSPVIPSGTGIGFLKKEICNELAIDPVQVIAVSGHDTQSALAAVPAQQEDFIFISCGTWSLFGTELHSPVMNRQSWEFNITNEGGCGGKISFLKNIIGLWMIQESRRQWILEGKEYGFSHLEQMASRALEFSAFIDPDEPAFAASGNIPERIREFCGKTGQKVPETEGSIVRCINESLAMKYRQAFDEIRSCTGKDYKAIHMVGGGIKSQMLCQMTANACNRPVIAGPVEATVFGNIAIQLMAAGEVADLAQARALVADSQECIIYEPKNTQIWESMYGVFREIINQKK